MKNNRLLLLLILILTAWCAVLSSRLNDIGRKDDSPIINQYEVNGFSTDFTKIVEDVKPEHQEYARKLLEKKNG